MDEIIIMPPAFTLTSHVCTSIYIILCMPLRASCGTFTFFSILMPEAVNATERRGCLQRRHTCSPSLSCTFTFILQRLRNIKTSE